MVGGSVFHLNLHLAIAWVYVIKLFLARGTGVGLLLGIKLLVNMEDATFATEEQAQGVDSGKLVGVQVWLRGKLVQQAVFYQDERTQIEIVANATYLIIDNRVGLQLTLDQIVVVGINHRCIRI